MIKFSFKFNFLFCLFLTFFCSSFFPPFLSTASSGDDIFYVENISSSASAKSARDAKLIASKQARKNAFITLLSRVKADQNIANIISEEQIFEAIISEQISDEKIAGNSYSANFNILFSNDIATRIIKNLSLQKFENSNYLLIPVLVENLENKRTNLIWQQENFWQNIVKKVVSEKKITNLIFAENDISNISIINEFNLAKLNFSDLESLISRYKLKGIHIIYFEQNLAENKMIVRIETFQNFQKKITSLNFVNNSNIAENEVNERIAAKTVKFIVDNQANFISEKKSKIFAEIKINSVNQMIEIKDKIERSGFINSFIVKSISKDFFTAEISTIANVKIEESFAAIGLKIEKKSDEKFLIYQN